MFQISSASKNDINFPLDALIPLFREIDTPWFFLFMIILTRLSPLIIFFK